MTALTLATFATLLRFSSRNSKIVATGIELGLKKSEIVAFDLPAGHTCPAANLCLSSVDRNTGKRTDKGEFVCYATKAECLYPSVRAMRWANYDALRQCQTPEDVAALIEASLPKGTKVIRIHSSGDFFSKAYFQGWVIFAARHPEVTIYGYTKIMSYVTAIKSDNFCLVYSYGSKMDKSWNGAIPTCFVIFGNDWTVSDDNTTAYNSVLNITVDVVCNGKGAESQDFEYITSGGTFGIIAH